MASTPRSKPSSKSNSKLGSQAAVQKSAPDKGLAASKHTRSARAPGDADTGPEKPPAKRAASPAPETIVAKPASVKKAGKTAPAQAARRVPKVALKVVPEVAPKSPAGKARPARAAESKPAAAQAVDDAAHASARASRRKLTPAVPESAGKTIEKRKGLSKAIARPLEETAKKARKKELKRVLKALQSLTDAGMVSGRYSLTAEENANFAELRRRLEANGTPAKKNSLVRAGLVLLAGLPTPALIAALAALPEVQDEGSEQEGG